MGTQRWGYYLPPGTVQLIRVFSDWERNKVQRFRSAAYPVQVLHPGGEKEVEAIDWRPLMGSGEAGAIWCPQESPG